jgi:hypothetical protein
VVRPARRRETDPHGGGISPAEPFPWNEADRMFTLLVKRAAELSDRHSGSPEEEEFDVLAAAIEAYEAKRWPEGLTNKLPHDRR